MAQSSHHGLDFGIDGGYNFSTNNGGGFLSTELSVGKRFNENFYWGMGTGLYIPTSGGDIMIPITTDVKVYMPLSSSNITPYIGLKSGYVINPAGDAIIVQLMPGMILPLSRCIDFNIGAGYMHSIPTKGGNGNGAVAIRAGINLHNTNLGKGRPLHESASNAFQVTLEAGGFMVANDDNFEYGGANVVVSYKVTPLLQAGVGIGYNVYSCPLTYNDGDSYSNVDDGFLGVFVRGQYRLTDRRLSPVIACDLGMRFMNGFYQDADINCKRMYVAPAVGLSIRSSQNSYVDLKVGYNMSAKLSGTLWSHECEGSLSSPFVQIGFTRTIAK